MGLPEQACTHFLPRVGACRKLSGAPHRWAQPYLGQGLNLPVPHSPSAFWAATSQHGPHFIPTFVKQTRDKVSRREA